MSDEHSFYPGLRPFRDETRDRQLFFGRDDDVDTLVAAIKSEPLVVVYGRSGVGKSSLLNAGVSPRLRDDGYFPITTRLTGKESSLATETIARINQEAGARGLLVSGASIGSSLWEFLDRVRFGDGERLMNPVLIFDPFEEIFTTVREHVGQRAIDVFVEDLADIVRNRVPADKRRELLDRTRALPTDSPERQEAVAKLFGSGSLGVRVVLSLREDRLPDLDELREALPSLYASAIRILPLSSAQARQAIEGPAALSRHGHDAFHFDVEVVDAILGFLEESTQRAWGEPAAAVDPSQLQLLCGELDRRRRRKTRNHTRIELSDLGGIKGMRKIIAQHYRRVLAAIPRIRPGWSGRRYRPSLDNLLIFHRPRAAARHLCEVGLVTRSGWRTTVPVDAARDEYGVPEGDLNVLEDRRLLTSDVRHGHRFVELSHDSLLAPVTASRRRGEVLRFAILGAAVACALIAFIDGFREARDTAAAKRLTYLQGEIARAPTAEQKARILELIFKQAQAGEKLSLAGTDLRGVRIPGPVTADVTFSGADLSASDLRKADFHSATFEHTKLAGANLADADLGGCIFYGADFRGADARGATFSNVGKSDFSNANLTGASFHAATLTDATLSAAIGLDSVDFTAAAWWEAAGWTEPQWDALERRFPHRLLRDSPEYEDALRELAADARWGWLRHGWNWSRFDRTEAWNDLAYYKVVLGFDPVAARRDADAAVRLMEGGRSKRVAADDRYALQAAYVYTNRAYIRLLLEDVAGALADVNSCLQNDPERGPCLQYRGFIYELNGNRELAQKDYQRAATLGFLPTYERFFMRRLEQRRRKELGQ